MKLFNIVAIASFVVFGGLSSSGYTSEPFALDHKIQCALGDTHPDCHKNSSGGHGSSGSGSNLKVIDCFEKGSKSPYTRHVSASEYEHCHKEFEHDEDGHKFNTCCPGIKHGTWNRNEWW